VWKWRVQRGPKGQYKYKSLVLRWFMGNIPCKLVYKSRNLGLKLEETVSIWPIRGLEKVPHN
jgi:hypothetical protein